MDLIPLNFFQISFHCKKEKKKVQEIQCPLYAGFLLYVFYSIHIHLSCLLILDIKAVHINCGWSKPFLAAQSPVS